MLGNHFNRSILGNQVLCHLIAVVALDVGPSRGGEDKSVLVVQFSQLLPILFGDLPLLQHRGSQVDFDFVPSFQKVLETLFDTGCVEPGIASVCVPNVGAVHDDLPLEEVWLRLAHNLRLRNWATVLTWEV